MGAYVNDEFVHECTGTIISENVVITTAHCFREDEENILYVKAGVLDLEKTGSFDRRVLKVVKHPKFQGPKHYYDVALVILDQTFEFDAKISPICLPTEASESADFMNRFTVTVQGWGGEKSWQAGGELTQIDLTIRSREICNSRYKNVPEHTVKIWFPDLVTSPMFCADSNLNPTKGTCNGDSGGPSMIRYSEINLCFIK